MWFDTHCHLYDLSEDAEEAIARAEQAGLEGIVVLGVDPTTSRKALDFAESSQSVWAGAAFHPSEVKGWADEWASEIEELLAHPRCVAVGETGLDFYHDTSYVEDQERAFIRHIELAKTSGKTLVIHTRKSADAALQALEETGPPERLIFHCWSGNRGQLDRALQLGAYISFAGNITYKNADDLRRAARAVPDDRLLVETDSPYLAPIPHRGTPNEPAYVAHVGAAVAAARGVEEQEVAALTSRNARAVFAVR
ncbi:MAG TPA: TatD family hydrolase [Actinomycetota bacterium]|nr:TatD family hydrolase [Actinomycetota bacterium]